MIDTSNTVLNVNLIISNSNIISFNIANHNSNKNYNNDDSSKYLNISTLFYFTFLFLKSKTNFSKRYIIKIIIIYIKKNIKFFFSKN